LRGFTAFSASEVSALVRLESRREQIDRGTELVLPGQKHTTPFVLIEGYLIEYRQDDDGHRQAIELLLRGDIANLRSTVLSSTDIHVAAASRAVIARFTAAQLFRVIAEHPRLGAVIVWRAALGRSILAEHLFDVGRRNAYQRLGHRLLELLVRMEWAGLAEDGTLPAPLDLKMLADMIGLSLEHTSRTLVRLRKDGLIDAAGPHIRIPDRLRLAEASGFEPSYLHLEGLPRTLNNRFR
jgi:CRP-like cAMP-binding protein